MDKEEKYKEARKRVKDLKGFYSHLFVYIAVNLGLFIINLLWSRDNWWFVYPLVGWGIAVLINGIMVLGVGSLFSSDWEEKKVKEIAERKE